MAYSTRLNDFNQRFAAEYLRVFPQGVVAQQSDDGALLFRGPVSPFGEVEALVGTHAVVSLEPAVHAALEDADPATKAEMMSILLSNLGTQLGAQYDALKIGSFALRVVDTKRILDCM